MLVEGSLDTPLAESVRKIGSQSAFARLVGKTQASVHGFLRDGKPLWPENVLTVEAATGVSKHRLRPDVDGPEPSDNALKRPALPAWSPRDDIGLINSFSLPPLGGERWQLLSPWPPSSPFIPFGRSQTGRNPPLVIRHDHALARCMLLPEVPVPAPIAQRSPLQTSHAYFLDLKKRMAERVY